MPRVRVVSELPPRITYRVPEEYSDVARNGFNPSIGTVLYLNGIQATNGAYMIHAQVGQREIAIEVRPQVVACSCGGSSNGGACEDILSLQDHLIRQWLDQNGFAGPDTRSLEMTSNSCHVFRTTDNFSIPSPFDIISAFGNELIKDTQIRVQLQKVLVAFSPFPYAIFEGLESDVLQEKCYGFWKAEFNGLIEQMMVSNPNWLMTFSEGKMYKLEFERFQRCAEMLLRAWDKWDLTEGNREELLVLCESRLRSFDRGILTRLNRLNQTQMDPMERLEAMGAAVNALIGILKSVVLRPDYHGQGIYRQLIGEEDDDGRYFVLLTLRHVQRDAITEKQYKQLKELFRTICTRPGPDKYRRTFERILGEIRKHLV